MTIKLTPARIALIVSVLVAAVAGVSYAAIPAADGTISACKDQKGILKVINAEAGQTCSGSQQLLTWNQQGPQGPAGQDGISGYQVVHGTSAQYDSADEKYAFATCPSGKMPVGGGGSSGHQAGPSYYTLPVALISSRSNGTAWFVRAREIVPTDEPWELIAEAICVTAS